MLPEAILPDNEKCSRLPGTDGNAKMSKSLGNCIYIKDSSEEIKRKVMGMYTDPNHIKVEDPGDTKNNTVFIYLEAFATDEHFKKYLPEYKNLDELKAHYERGGLGDMKVKRFLNDVMQEVMEPLRNRREEYEKRKPEVFDMLKQGTLKAIEHTNKILNKVKSDIGINYFEDEEFKNKFINN